MPTPADRHSADVAVLVSGAVVCVLAALRTVVLVFKGVPDDGITTMFSFVVSIFGAAVAGDKVVTMAVRKARRLDE